MLISPKKKQKKTEREALKAPSSGECNDEKQRGGGGNQGR
jgi:hypothetical protein